MRVKVMKRVTPQGQANRLGWMRIGKTIGQAIQRRQEVRRQEAHHYVLPEKGVGRPDARLVKPGT